VINFELATSKQLQNTEATPRLQKRKWGTTVQEAALNLAYKVLEIKRKPYIPANEFCKNKNKS